MNFHALNIGILHFEIIILYCRCTKKNGASTVFFMGRGAMDETEKLAGQLQEMGFSKAEAAYYLKLFSAGECSNPERLRILGAKRKTALDEIHRLESAIMSMDTMRNDIRNKK